MSKVIHDDIRGTQVVLDDPSESEIAQRQKFCLDSIEHTFILHWRELVDRCGMTKLTARHLLLDVINTLDSSNV